MKMEQTECSKMSAYKIQTPGNYPEENIQVSIISTEKDSYKINGILWKTTRLCSMC